MEKISPKDYFKKLAFSIKDAEIRLVAAIMSDYVGEENAVRLDTLCRRVSMDERKVRLILGKLVTEYGVPVCAHSGKAGRWPALFLFRVTEYGVPVCAHSGKAGRWPARSFDEARVTPSSTSLPAGVVHRKKD